MRGIRKRQAMNRIQVERQSVPGLTPVILDRDYDSRGNRIATSVTMGGTIAAGAGGGTVSGGVKDLVNTYSFDTLGRTTAITQTGVAGGNVVAAKRADYGYNVAGQVTDLRRYSAATPSTGSLEVHSRSGYDSAGRLTSLIHNRTEITGSSPYTGGSSLPTSVTPATAIAAYAFTFDAGNRMTAMSSYADRFRTTYGYDNSDQLTAASSVAIAGLAAPTFLPVAEGYQLDANGNRRSSTGASQSAAGTHNQLQTDGTFNYTYDNEGNTTRKTAIAGGAYTEYVWNHRNQLTAVIDRTSAGVQVKRSDYTYDAFDRRTLDRYDAPGAAGYDRYDWFITDGQHELIVMRDSNGAATVQNYRIANRFLHGASVDEVLSDEQYASGSGPLLSSTTASTIAGTTLWTIADHLGSIRDVVDNSGVVRQHVVYDSFGRRVNEVDRSAAGAVIASNSTEAIDELFGYTGRDFDAETGLQYNRARWFDPGTGRWMSRDPIGFEAGDANLYRYVGNQPTTKTDPSGLRDPDATEPWPAGPIGRPKPPGRPGGPLTVDEKKILELSGTDEQLRAVLDQLIGNVRKHGPGFYGAGAAYGGITNIGKYADLEGKGWCNSWVDYVDPFIPRRQGKIVVYKVDWYYSGQIPIYSGHAAIRVELLDSTGRVREIFYIDNGWIGGKDNIFFPGDIPNTLYGEMPNVLSDGTPAPASSKLPRNPSKCRLRTDGVSDLSGWGQPTSVSPPSNPRGGIDF